MRRALQEHPEDIPKIAKHFLRHYAQVFQKPMEGIEADAMAMLAELLLARQCART